MLKTKRLECLKGIQISAYNMKGATKTAFAPFKILPIPQAEANNREKLLEYASNRIKRQPTNLTGSKTK